MNFRILIALVLLFGFSSCLQKDAPIQLPAQGDAISQNINQGADYGTQFYYNLKEGEIVHSGLVDSWHLAFESSSTGDGVFINGGLGMALIETKKADLAQININDYTSSVWLQDDPNGKKIDGAFKNWNLTDKTREEWYLVRLTGDNSQLRAVRIVQVDKNEFAIEVGNLKTQEVHFCQVYKDPTRVYTYLNLNTNDIVEDVEPLKETWDLLFTRYGFTFYDQDPPLPYVVTGVLTNPSTKVFKDSTASFYDVGDEIISTQTFSMDRDVIGYTWKYYDFDLGLYHIRQDYNYIIKTQHHDIFKLRFLSFYDNNGVKGSPTFEFKQLQ